MLGASDESVVDGEKHQCMGAGKHQAGMDSGIEGGTSIFMILSMMKEEREMENDVMFGEISRKRMRGRPRTRWMDIVNNIK